VNLFLESVHRILKIAHQLGAHGIPLFLGLPAQIRERLLPQLLQLFLPSRDIDLQFLEILQVLLIETVKHSHILEHLHSSLVQLPLDAADLHLQVLIALDKFFQASGGRLQKWDLIGKAVLIQLIHSHIFYFHYQIRHQLSHIAAVLGANLGENIVRETRNISLSSYAVLQGGLRIHQVNAVFDLLHPRQLLRRERLD